MADELLNEIRQWAYSKFRSEDFPDDVTRQVFRHIRATPELYAKYEVRVGGVGDQLHKEIGQMVKGLLGAEVVYNSFSGKPEKIRCTPATDIIKTCTRLRPGGSGARPRTARSDTQAAPSPSDDSTEADSPPDANEAVSSCPPLGVAVTTSRCFPFGQPLQELRQVNRSPKKVFVLGVYASAVHARWIGPDGGDMVRALAVASEPCIFWRGEGADTIINRIAIPPQVGKLVPADPRLNGPSGIALDEKFFQPLGLTRDQAWLCDLVPHSCANESQAEAIQRDYLPLAAKHSLPIPSIPPVPDQLADAPRRVAILEELRESQARVLVLLGDQPIRWFLRFFDPRWSKLSEFGAYGRLHATKIDGLDVQVLPLAHPRQASRLGSSSATWSERHDGWSKTTARNLVVSRN